MPKKSGICCWHASVILQHYLQCHRRTNDLSKNHTMLDICDFMRVHLDPEKQKQYIAKGTCGLASEDFFMIITGIKDFELQRRQISKRTGKKEGPAKDTIDFRFRADTSHFFNEFCGEANRLQAPALVSRFRIEKGFHDKHVLDRTVDQKEFAEYAKSKGKPDGIWVEHSMVLIGAFMDETGKGWFLMQNFWKGEFFKLVSAEYMASCLATIVLVPKQCSVSLAGNYSTMDSEYVESEVCLEECAPYVPPLEES
ncbi:MAG: hypothetical protein SGILL_008975 [Bacillariaceae sp.]